MAHAHPTSRTWSQTTHPSLPTMHCYSQSACYFLMTKGTQLLVFGLQHSVTSSALTSGQQKLYIPLVAENSSVQTAPLQIKIIFLPPSLIVLNAAFRTISNKVLYNCMILVTLGLYHMVKCITVLLTLVLTSFLSDPEADRCGCPQDAYKMQSLRIHLELV